VASDKWEQLEKEVDKLNCDDVDYQSSMGLLTDKDIAILASDLNALEQTQLKEHPNDLHLKQNINDLKHNFGKKRSILRKLMIAQRKKFNLKREIKAKEKANIADSSFSDVSETYANIKTPQQNSNIK
jgi:hypothetical protein